VKPGRIGLITGSGLYEIEGLETIEQREIETPFGAPSDAFTIGRLAGREVVFLRRHGPGHRIMPSELNFRANIFGFKLLGVDRIIATGTVGSLREEIHPLDVVIPDQFVDRTWGRASTFFGDGIVGHIAFGDPVCAGLSDALFKAATASGARVHKGGTYVCMEGPALSTRGESELYRKWGMDIIGMTNLQEAKLAREAEICYASIALVTDYDCWHPLEAGVTVDMILENMRRNLKTAKAILKRVLTDMPDVEDCPCRRALAGAIITSRDAIPAETLRKLEPIVGKYLKG